MVGQSKRRLHVKIQFGETSQACHLVLQAAPVHVHPEPILKLGIQGPVLAKSPHSCTKNDARCPQVYTISKVEAVAIVQTGSSRGVTTRDGKKRGRVTWFER